MGELSPIGRVIRGARTFSAGAITGATAAVLLADLRRRLDEADELLGIVDELGERFRASVNGLAPGAYRAVCLHCRKPLTAYLDETSSPASIGWRDSSNRPRCVAPDWFGRAHEPVGAWRLAELDAHAPAIAEYDESTRRVDVTRGRHIDHPEREWLDDEYGQDTTPDYERFERRQIELDQDAAAEAGQVDELDELDS